MFWFLKIFSSFAYCMYPSFLSFFINWQFVKKYLPIFNITAVILQHPWHDFNFFIFALEKEKGTSNIKYYMLIMFLNKILGSSYIYIVQCNAQNLPYYILVLTKLPFFSLKSRRLFTVQSPTCPPSKLCVTKSIMAIELRKRLWLIYLN